MTTQPFTPLPYTTRLLTLEADVHTVMANAEPCTQLAAEVACLPMLRPVTVTLVAPVVGPLARETDELSTMSNVRLTMIESARRPS